MSKQVAACGYGCERGLGTDFFMHHPLCSGFLPGVQHSNTSIQCLSSHHQPKTICSMIIPVAMPSYFPLSFSGSRICSAQETPACTCKLFCARMLWGQGFLPARKPDALNCLFTPACLSNLDNHHACLLPPVLSLSTPRHRYRMESGAVPSGNRGPGYTLQRLPACHAAYLAKGESSTHRVSAGIPPSRPQRLMQKRHANMHCTPCAGPAWEPCAVQALLLVAPKKGPASAPVYKALCMRMTCAKAGA
jgi:hypothetical protein